MLSFFSKTVLEHCGTVLDEVVAALVVPDVAPSVEEIVLDDIEVIDAVDDELVVRSPTGQLTS